VSAWNSVASSAEGTHLVAGIGGGIATTTNVGPVYISTDSGGTWTPTDAPSNFWASVASSADGNKLVAVANGGGIYTWQSVPTPVLSISGFSSGLLLSWVIPSQNFLLQQNSGLVATNWVDVPISPILNLTNLHNEVTVPTPTGTAFYRLVLR
jgi:hypothetical protein